MSTPTKILICGGNEIASATAVKLQNCGFEVLVAASEDENLLRYHLCLGDTLMQGQKILENATATVLADDLLGDPGQKDPAEKFLRAVYFAFRDRSIPVIPLTDLSLARSAFAPQIIVNFYSPHLAPVSIDDAPLVVGTFPGHTPGSDCHVAVETRLSFHLGRIYSPSHNIPEDDSERIFFTNPFAYCKSPLGGVWLALKSIGEPVRYNEPLGRVDDIEIRSPHNGQIWGLTHSGKFIAPHCQIALIYLGAPGDHYRYLGFRETCIAGGVVEAVLHFG